MPELVCISFVIRHWSFVILLWIGIISEKNFSMSFLSAAFLIALPLVAVPVAIHLYRGRQRDVILWGAMQFLAAAVTKGRRMERLEELLLMALRFAAVAALVLALARPMVRSSWLGNTTDGEVILVLDNSLSMSREAEGDSAGGKMREQALELVDSLSAADGVQVILASGSEWATAESIAADSAGRQRLRKIVEEAEPTLGSANLLACLQAAVHLQPENEPAGRRIVVFTDNQRSGWQTDAAGAWQQLKVDCDASVFPITIEVVDSGLDVAEVDNLAVTDVRAAKNLIRPGEQVELAADIVNTGDVPTEKTNRGVASRRTRLCRRRRLVRLQPVRRRKRADRCEWRMPEFFP